MNLIVKYLKDQSVTRGETQSISSAGDSRQRVHENRGTAQKSVRSDMSEERFKEKHDEMQKTIKEKEFLQKRTNELLFAMQQKN